MNRIIKFAFSALCVLGFLLSFGCERRQPTQTLTPVTLQTDWFPQAEHGGFYQALAKGYYREAGLEVTILPGGPNSFSVRKILGGQAQFAMNRADTIYALSQKGIPVQMVMASLRNDPQALMLHPENPIESLAQLDGASVMAVPGLMWIRWLEAKFGIRLEILPHDYGMDRFLADPAFIQQCLITNEPFYLRQRGVEPKLLRLAETGFNPPHGIYALRSFLNEQPETAHAFITASIRGWEDFMLGDPSPAFELISQRNPKMTREFLLFSHGEMVANELVMPANAPEATGQLSPTQLMSLAQELHLLGLIEGEIKDDWFSVEFMRDFADP